MTDQALPCSDNVVLYAKPNQIANPGLAEVKPIAFKWNGKGDGLSANWLEYFNCLTKGEQLDRIRDLIHREMAATGGLAELNVGKVIEQISEELSDPRFLHTPSPPQPPRYPNEDPTHCELAGLPPPSDPFSSAIADMIAQCVSEIHPTRSSGQ